MGYANIFHARHKLEALECLSSSVNVLGITNQGNISSFEPSNIPHGILKPYARDSSNWISEDVAFHLEHHAKIDLALKYFSKLIMEHPSWEDIIVGSAGSHVRLEKYEHPQFLELLESFQHKFDTELVQFEQKFSLLPICLISKVCTYNIVHVFFGLSCMRLFTVVALAGLNFVLSILQILVSFYNHGLLFAGYDLFRRYITQDHLQDNIQTVDGICFYSLMNKPLFKVTEETSLLFSRFIVACGVTCSQVKSHLIENDASCESVSSWSNAWEYDFQCLLLSLRILRASLRMTYRFVSEDLIMKPLVILDLVEYFIYFAYAWLQRSSRVLFQIVEPLLLSRTNEHTLYDVDIANLKKLLPEIADVVHSLLHLDVGNGPENSNNLLENQASDIKHSIPEDEQWHIIGACLWQHMSRFIRHKLNNMSYELEDVCFSGLSHARPSVSSNAKNLESDENSLKEQSGLVSSILVKILKTTVEYVSSHHVKQLASYLHKEMEYGWQVKTLVWLEESSQTQSRAPHQNRTQDIVHPGMMNDKDGFNRLWDICSDPKMISESFAVEKISCLSCFDHKPSKGWNDIYEGVNALVEAEEANSQEGSPSNSSVTTEMGTPTRGLFRNSNTFSSSWQKQKDTTTTKEVASFRSPREVLKRNGELLEVTFIYSF